MNKQQIVDRVTEIATQSDNLDIMKSKIFLLLSDLYKEDLTLNESYNLRIFPSEIRREVILREHSTCAYCNRPGTIGFDPDGFPWNVDHVIPYSRGGLTCLDNAVLSCNACNYEKKDMTPAEYIRKLKFSSSQFATTNGSENSCEQDRPTRKYRGKWTNWIVAYAERNSSVLQSPPVGIRDLAKSMSIHDTGDEDSYMNYVGTASETCRMLREGLEGSAS